MLSRLSTQGSSNSKPPRLHSDTVCVLQTSGSSGASKYVALVESAVVHRLQWQAGAYPLGASAVVAVKTRPSFVDSLWELLAPAVAGVHRLRCSSRGGCS